MLELIRLGGPQVWCPLALPECDSFLVLGYSSCGVHRSLSKVGQSSESGEVVQSRLFGGHVIAEFSRNRANISVSFPRTDEGMLTD
jgi:hypothetical protein